MTTRDVPAVLIIDDDAITTLMLAGMLRQGGFTVISAATGIDGVAAVQQQRPDLILLDVNLPDMDGFAVCREILQVLGITNIPVLFISANDDAVTRVKGFDAGGVDYIAKPLFGPEIIARVRTHLRLARAQDTIANLQAQRISALAQTQKMMFPPVDAQRAAGCCAHIHQKHGAGGDFFDVIATGPQIFDYVVADASGHEIETALWTTGFKALLREYSSALYSPVEIMHAVNNSLVKILPQGFYFTATYVRLNRKTNKLTIANAGHPPVVIVPQDQNAVLAPIIINSDVVGAFVDARFLSVEKQLCKGDRILMYTDGLTARVSVEQNSANPGSAEIVAACTIHRGRPIDEMVRAVVDDLLKSATNLDDAILLGIEV